MIFCSRAPVRFDFGGGWTDVSPYPETEGGYVLNTALDMYAYVTLRWRDDSRIVITAEDYGTTIESDNLAALGYDGQCDLAKAALRYLAPERGLELVYRCEAPVSAGLGGSGAMGVALAACINRALGRNLNPGDLADLACVIEIDELGIPGGRQDQAAAAFGGLNLLYFDGNSTNLSAVRISDAVRNELERRIVLCYTGAPHLSGNLIEKGRAHLLEQNPRVVGAFHRMRAIAQEIKEALLNGNLNTFATLLNDNWQQQQKLDSTIGNDRLDGLWTVANKAGAMACKAGGAGGGGCVAYFCAPGRESAVAAALIAAGGQIVPFHMTKNRAQTWLLDETTGKVLL